MANSVNLVNEIYDDFIYKMRESAGAAPKEKEKIKKTALEFIKDIEVNCGTSKEIKSIKSKITSYNEKSASSPCLSFVPSRCASKGSAQGVAASSSDVETIRGDGHCFFRSTAHGLIDLHQSNKDFLSGLQKQKEAFEEKGTEADKKIADSLGKLITLIPQGRSKSDQLVQVLRDLSCDYNESYHPERGLNRAYFSAMKTTNKWGGAPEIAALEKLLGVQICTSREELSLYDGTIPIVPLVYSSGHYNLLKRKAIDLPGEKAPSVLRSQIHDHLIRCGA